MRTQPVASTSRRSLHTRRAMLGDKEAVLGDTPGRALVGYW